MSRILCTGAAGFIGSAFSAKLQSHGHTVLGIDNFNRYYNPELKVARMDYFKLNIAATNINCCDQIWFDFKPEIVVHFAAQAGVRYSLEDPNIYIETNLSGTHHLLELNRIMPARLFVFISSSSVYNADIERVCENSPTAKPATLYAASKASGEFLCYNHAVTHKNKVLTIRPFTVYGPWGRPDMAIWKFVEACLTGAPIKLHGAGEQYRDWTYIDNFVEALYRLVFMRHEPLYDIFNICKGSADYLRYVVYHIIHALQCSWPEIIDMPMQYGDARSKEGINRKLKQYTGYSPSTTVEIGISKFIGWYRSYHNV